ncbi:MAG TPA: hypothetical protein VFP60_03695 [Pseudolabrys sp.]|nr:hypothetical protein [Pseudolabrys sp.]
MRTEYAIGVLSGIVIAAMTTSALAQVRDAVYRGTLVCDKLPFSAGKGREAIEVTISRGSVRYTHVVRLGRAVEPILERGIGTLHGQDISLQGSWRGGGHQYEAKYSGAFVRRHASLKGTQTWSEGGRTITRTCSGVIKRPLRVFLPRDKT